MSGELLSLDVRVFLEPIFFERVTCVLYTVAVQAIAARRRLKVIPTRVLSCVVLARTRAGGIKPWSSWGTGLRPERSWRGSLDIAVLVTERHLYSEARNSMLILVDRSGSLVRR